MDSKYQVILKKLEKKAAFDVHEFRDEVTLVTKPEHIITLAASLRDEHDFDVLSNITAVDYWPQVEPRFNLIYLIRSLPKHLLLTLRVPLLGDNPSIETLEKIYPNANWYEREVWDLFGIKFNNHSDMRRLVMPYEWQGHPLRKDYPLGYEEVQFTFNREDIDKRKNYALK